MLRQHAGSSKKPSWNFRLRPLEALRELGKIRRDPEDLVAIARFFFSVGGHDDGTIYERICRVPEARRVLDERLPLPSALTNLEALRTYPEGSLARCHAEDLERNGLDPAQIDADTRLAQAGLAVSAEHDFIRVRTRSLHDLLHTLTGYCVDMLGEGAIVAFTYSNFGNRGYRMLAWFNCAKHLVKGELTAISFVFDGFRRGRKAKFLWGCDWDALLALPLEDVREQLGIEAVPPYDPIPFPHRVPVEVQG